MFSYSQLSSFDECPYSYYLQRIEKVDETLSNPFSERGSLIHDLLDQWAKGNLKKEDMPDEYDRRYGDEVVSAYPPFMSKMAMEKYKSGREFLENFDEFRGYKVVSAEEKFTIDLMLSDGTTRPFTGVVDMILRKDWTDELIICDHKSKSAEAFKKAEKEMWRQQYLYSQYVFEKYGEWPKILMFNLFGDNGSKPEKEFNLTEFRETIQWATERIKHIENNTVLDWLECKDSSDFYCQNLCSVRTYCPRSTEKPLTKKEKAELQERKEEELKNLSSVEIVPEQPEETEKETAQETETLRCECGEPYVKGKRKCPKCKAWYKVRI